MATLDFVFVSAIVTANGFGQAGAAEKCGTPKFKAKTEKYHGGGMWGEREILLGWEAFRFKTSLTSYDPNVIGLAGAPGISWSVNGRLDGDRNGVVPVSLQMIGQVVEFDPGEWEPGKKAMANFEVALTALTLTVGSTQVYDINLISDTFTVGGVDYLTASSFATAVANGVAALAG